MKRHIWIWAALMGVMIFALSACDWKMPDFEQKPKTKKELVAEFFAKLTPPPTAVPTPSPTPGPSPTPIPTPTPTPAPIDWSKEYDDYFQSEQFLPKNYRVETTVVIEGVEAQVSLAQTETFDSLSLGLGKTNVYIFSNGSMVFLGKQYKTSEEWYFTRVESEDDLEKLLGMNVFMDFDSMGDIVIGQVYQGNVAEEDKIYDIIDIVTSQEYGKIKVRLYINRDTQKIERLQTDYNGQTILVHLWEIDPLELPEGSARAKSLTKDEFSEKYKKAILQGASSAIGGKLWN